MSNVKTSKDGKVRFDADTHSYWLGDKQLQGVTGYIGKFKNKFDIEAEAAKYAAKNGLDKLAVMKEWKELGRISCENGTAVHKVFEDYFSTGIAQTSLEYPKTTIAAKFIQEIFKSKRLTPVEVEYLVYNDTLASMIDMIAKNQRGEYFILDWKTNKEIKKDSWGKYMLSPYSLLPDASYYHYSLQVAIYKKLCTDYDIKECFIVHIGDTDYQILKPENIVIHTI